ncbi:unnamed protein product [Orchesella dallaii]|uniref:Secreted protein n=1 Tax=Orchesella dallaii TaxID=48710 RepID=A0ABP1Q0P5_9HEXA
MKSFTLSNFTHFQIMVILISVLLSIMSTANGVPSPHHHHDHSSEEMTTQTGTPCSQQQHCVHAEPCKKDDHHHCSPDQRCERQTTTDPCLVAPCPESVNSVCVQ